MLVTLLDGDTCYRALSARDARFDGVFYVAVSTTGIYCRPVCTVRRPGRDRCTFYASAPEAERAGYRACFRCRPELAPGHGSVDASARLARRAVARIDEGALNDRSLQQLADELSVSSRHLRRAIEEHVGVSPVELAQSRRLALAKQLLHDSTLPLTEVAFASGFRSIRRFNALFLERFGRAPSDVRRGHGDASAGLAVRVGYRAPLPWETLLTFLGGRAIPGVERVTADRYTRAVRIGSARGTLVVRRDPRRPALVAELSASLAVALPAVAARVRSLFDLDAAPDVIDAHLGRDPLLAPLVARTPGMRVPGAFDVFEVGVRTVLGQQISVRAAATLAGRLVARWGDALPAELAVDGLTHTFPTPSVLRAAGAAAVADIGLPLARAQTLVALAAAFERDDPALHRDADLAATVDALCALPGLGPWSAQYLAMRGFSHPDAFPASDLGVRKALGDLPPARAIERAGRWSPWRAYAVLHLWNAPQESP